VGGHDSGISGFAYRVVAVGGTRYRVGVAGDGPPVLLLHGFPQTHWCWRGVAPGLADGGSRGRTVVVCDLKGYGSSRGAAPGPQGEGYSNRDRAAELLALMAALGHERFAVVGHDRGARVAYRMALDHPLVVERLCVLNVVPTVEQFQRMGDAPASDFWPWFLLAQPPDFVARLLAPPNGELAVRHALASWAARPDAIAPEDAERYVRAFTPEALAGICADYRAAMAFDRAHDAEDRAAGRRIACPVLVHWGAAEDPSPEGPLPVWRRWAGEVCGAPLPGGHFVPEEAPAKLLASLRKFLS